MNATTTKTKRVDAPRRQANGCYDTGCHRSLCSGSDVGAPGRLNDAPASAARPVLSGRPAAALTNGQGHSKAKTVEPSDLPAWLAGEAERYRILGTEAAELAAHTLEVLASKARSLADPGRSLDASAFLDRVAYQAVRDPLELVDLYSL
jgi:hypothetical protein